MNNELDSVAISSFEVDHQVLKCRMIETEHAGDDKKFPSISL